MSRHSHDVSNCRVRARLDVVPETPYVATIRGQHDITYRSAIDFNRSEAENCHVSESEDLRNYGRIIVH